MEKHARVGASDAPGQSAERSTLVGVGIGLAVADADGALVWWDDTLDESIRGVTGASGHAPRCCELFGCATAMAGEPSGERCMTSAALSRHEGLPARATRIGGPDGAAVSVSAMPMQAERGPLVALHVSFGTGAVAGAADASIATGLPKPTPKRRGVRPAPAPGPAELPELRISALGPLRVEVGGVLRSGDWLRQRPGELLRYLLAQRGRPAPAEDIAAAVWPDRGPAALSNVRYCAYHLRRQLDGLPPGSGLPSLVVHREGGYQLAVDRLVLDVEPFELGVEAGLAAYRKENDQRAMHELSAALDLYRGDFLSDEPYAEWALLERDYLHERAARALWAYADLNRRTGRLEEAAGCLRRLTELEPFDTDVAQELIEVCLQRGRRSEAVRHYRALRLRLRRAFDEQPDFELAELASRVSAGAAARAAAAA